MLQYTRVPLATSVVTRLVDITAEHTTLEKLLTWCTKQTPPHRFEAMITQDEYTSDVIVRFEELYLVYDTN